MVEVCSVLEHTNTWESRIHTGIRMCVQGSIRKYKQIWVRVGDTKGSTMWYCIWTHDFWHACYTGLVFMDSTHVSCFMISFLLSLIQTMILLESFCLVHLKWTHTRVSAIGFSTYDRVCHDSNWLIFSLMHFFHGLASSHCWSLKFT